MSTATQFFSGNSGGLLLRRSFFSTAVFTVPAGVRRIRAKVYGGGGGGAARTAASVIYAGGGGGGYAEGVYAVTPGAAITVTVGTGGAGLVTATAGVAGAGGTSSFGAFATATGGTGGTIAGSGTGSAGAGGNGSGGQINILGANAATGLTAALMRGGNGGGLDLAQLVARQIFLNTGYIMDYPRPLGIGGSGVSEPGVSASSSNYGALGGGGGSGGGIVSGVFGSNYGGDGLVILEWAAP